MNCINDSPHRYVKNEQGEWRTIKPEDRIRKGVLESLKNTDSRCYQLLGRECMEEIAQFVPMMSDEQIQECSLLLALSEREKGIIYKMAQLISRVGGLLSISRYHRPSNKDIIYKMAQLISRVRQSLFISRVRQSLSIEPLLESKE